jgi:CubicO group peptidase (beta-lactamase class C family)
VAIVRGARIETAGFGHTRRGGDAVTGDTVFQAASLSKPVFARIALLLVREGALDLDRPLPKPAAADDPRLAAVSPRQLLQHTAGLPNWSRGPLRLESEPGARWSYSGQGYVQLQAAVEAVSGQTLDRLADRLVFAPLAMTSSTLVTPRDRIVARGHDEHGQPTETDRFDRAVAASSLHTSARDYARFVRSLLVSPPGESPAIDAMLDGGVEVDRALGLSWGIGWAIEDHAGQRVFFHWGANPGFRALVLGWPRRAEAIVLLANGEGGLDLAAELVERVTGERHPLFRFRLLHPTD